MKEDENSTFRDWGTILQSGKGTCLKQSIDGTARRWRGTVQDVIFRLIPGAGLKFRRNFAKFGNFGGGRKKNPKFCNTLIHVLYNFRLNFLLFILHIFVFNRCVVINHTNICLDLNVFFRKSILHVLVSKKISPKFRPNFAKFGSFGDG